MFFSDDCLELVVFVAEISVLLLHFLDFFVDVLFRILIFEDGEGVADLAAGEFHARVEGDVVGFGDLASESAVEEVDRGGGGCGPLESF
jgi:hypothetical protein